MLTNTYRRR